MKFGALPFLVASIDVCTIFQRYPNTFRRITFSGPMNRRTTIVKIAHRIEIWVTTTFEQQAKYLGVTCFSS